jgi:hypothetical protein
MTETGGQMLEPVRIQGLERSERRLADLQAEIEQLERQLLRFGGHTADCDSRSPSGALRENCDCGWSALRATLAGVTAAPRD